METGYRNFCKTYKEKLETDKDIEENKQSIFEDHRKRIWFYICSDYSYPMQLPSFIPYKMGAKLFNLDKEDLDYLYNKYSNKIEEELQRNIEELKKDYDINN